MKASVWIGLVLTLAGCGGPAKPTVEQARAFLDDAEAKLLAMSVESSRAAWVKDTYIIDDSEAVSAKADERLINATVDLVKQSKGFDGMQLPEDLAPMWRAKYDMDPDAFAKELDRLWDQVRPLYLSLHAYVRTKLREKYGDAVPANGPIPADLLGNMWAQEWGNIYPLVAPKNADPGFDLTQILKSKRTEPKEMARYGESFFKSLGFAPLPATFWERSLFVKPR